MQAGLCMGRLHGYDVVGKVQISGLLCLGLCVCVLSLSVCVLCLSVCVNTSEKMLQINSKWIEKFCFSVFVALFLSYFKFISSSPPGRNRMSL